MIKTKRQYHIILLSFLAIYYSLTNITIAQETIKIAQPQATEQNSLEKQHSSVDDYFLDVIGKPKKERLEIAYAALKSSQNGIDQSPLNVLNHLIKVSSLGTIARALTISESIQGRYGSKSKRAITDLINLSPSGTWSQALTGIWNIEVHRRGGQLVSLLLGASKKRGIELLDQVTDTTEKPTIAFAYAVTLISLGDEKEFEKAQQLLLTFQKNTENIEQDHSIIKKLIPISNDLLQHITNQDYEIASELSRTIM